MAKKIIALPDQNLRVSVLFTDVTITLSTRSSYEAQVLYEDIVERLQSGETIGIESTAPKKGKP